MIFEKDGELHFYTGKPGGDVSKHNAKFYKEIAQQILDQVTDDKDEEGNPIKKWPKPAKVDIIAGTKEVTVDWEKCASEEDMRQRF